MKIEKFDSGIFYNADNVSVMKEIKENIIDLTVTSPPYDNLRDYTNDDEWSFNKFKEIANELYRITKNGGVVVWIVADATIKGSETGTSFRQALYFKEVGFNIHDTMIWNKGGFSAVGALKTRYAPVFEYMFVFSKGKPKTFNPLKDRENKIVGKIISKTKRQKDGSIKKGKSYLSSKFGQRFNVWEMSPHRQKGGHPAPFPISLIKDHILSWSNENDLIFDPFMGSGTTAIAAMNTKRNWLGIEISSEYFNVACQRIRGSDENQP